jgi:hypothetical protein
VIQTGAEEALQQLLHFLLRQCSTTPCLAKLFLMADGMLLILMVKNGGQGGGRTI